MKWKKQLPRVVCHGRSDHVKAQLLRVPPKSQVCTVKVNPILLQTLPQVDKQDQID
ncbi:hypothetical protein PtB15_17B310 [Puccinia triticina]|nr:hypothetical protein PtB15_17B310 [Puccinia triticina]